MSSTTGRKSERLLNLLIMLLVQRHYVSKDRIREFLYPDASTEAFEKMFERDKEELRSLGVPIEVGNMDAYFDDEPGYRVRPDRLALPDIALTPDEAAVIGLATRVWQHARLADATTEAVRKLTALGVEVDESALDIAEPRLSADEPSFDVFWEATQERTPVEFDYRRPGARRDHHPAPAALGRRALLRALVRRRPRHRPRRGAGLPALPGRGRGPHDRHARRRTTSRPAPTSARPPSAWRPRRRPARPSSWSAATPASRCARDAVSVETDVAGPDSRTPWDRVRISRGGTGVADEVLGYGAAVYVESPAELRAEVVDRLRAVVGGRRWRHEHPAGRGQGPGRPAADAGAVPARPRRGAARGRRRRARRARRAGARRPQRAADVRPARAATPTTSSTSTSTRSRSRAATASSGSPTPTTWPGRCG